MNTLGQIVQNGLSLLAVFVFLMTFHWRVSLLLVASFVPGLIVQIGSADKMFQFYRATTERERQTNYFHHLLTSTESAKEARIFGFGETIRHWYRDLRTALCSEKIRVQYLRLILEFSVKLGTSAAQFSA